MMCSLDRKLAEIRANPSTRAFIFADAKDADMAFGVRAPGPRVYLPRHGARVAQFLPEVLTREEFGCRNFPEFLDVIREVVHQGVLQAKKIKPHRSLENGHQATDQVMSFDGSAKTRATVEVRNKPLAKMKPESSIGISWPQLANGNPDFERMNSDQRLAYDQVRLK